MVDGNLVSAASAAFGAIKALVGERDRQKALAIELEFGEKLKALQAQLVNQLTTMTEQRSQIDELQEELRTLRTNLAQAQQVELVKVGSVGQFFAYRNRDSTEGVEGATHIEHLLCQPCFETNKRGILRNNGSGYWSCPICRDGFQAEPPVSMETLEQRVRWRDSF